MKSGIGTAKESRAELFAIYYVATLNATQSAISAGYAESSASAEGSRLLTNNKVRHRIRQLMDERIELAKLDSQVVLNRLDQMSSVDLLECFDENNQFKSLREIPKAVRLCIKSIKVFEEWDGVGRDRTKAGEIREITFWDKVKATELLGKNLKLFADDKTITHKHSLEDLVTGRAAQSKDVTPGVSLIEGPDKETPDVEEITAEDQND